MQSERTECLIRGNDIQSESTDFLNQRNESVIRGNELQSERTYFLNWGNEMCHSRERIANRENIIHQIGFSIQRFTFAIFENQRTFRVYVEKKTRLILSYSLFCFKKLPRRSVKLSSCKENWRLVFFRHWLSETVRKFVFSHIT